MSSFVMCNAVRQLAGVLRNELSEDMWTVKDIVMVRSLSSQQNASPFPLRFAAVISH